jgi:hypothetical protein
VGHVGADAVAGEYRCCSCDVRFDTTATSSVIVGPDPSVLDDEQGDAT